MNKIIGTFKGAKLLTRDCNGYLEPFCIKFFQRVLKRFGLFPRNVLDICILKLLLNTKSIDSFSLKRRRHREIFACFFQSLRLEIFGSLSDWYHLQIEAFDFDYSKLN